MQRDSTTRQFQWLDALLVITLLLILLIQFLPVVRGDLSWEDETLHASTSLALLHGQTNATVLADFPHTHSLLGFYGPVGFWMGAAAFKLLGFSRLSWRLYIFAGNLLLYFGTFLLFRGFGASRRFALLILIALSFSMEESFRATTNGRDDVWAVGGLLLAIAIATRASRLHFGRHAASLWVLAGAVAGIFLAYTPRGWVLWTSFSLVLFLAGCFNKSRRTALLSGVALTNLAALASLWLVLAPIGSNPLQLLQTVHRGSQNDKLNSSPLLGGTWGFGQTHTQALFYLLVVFILGAAALHKKFRDRFTPQAKWFTLAVVLNAVLQFLLLSRALGNSFFWGIPLLLSALGVFFFVLQSNDIPALPRSLVLVPGFLVLVMMLALRVASTGHAYVEANRDHTSQLKQFIATNIPPHSVVYGPWGIYFFPLEERGIDYRYATEQTTRGLDSTDLGLDNPSPLTPTLCQHPSYVLWPSDAMHDTPMQANLQADLGEEVAELPTDQRPKGRLAKLFEKFPGANKKDPSGAILYRLKPPAASACAALASAHP
jgi:hypothetical protein